MNDSAAGGDGLVVTAGRPADAPALAQLYYEAHRPFCELCFGGPEAALRFIEATVRDESAELAAAHALVVHRGGSEVVAAAALSAGGESAAHARREAFLLRREFAAEAAAVHARLKLAAAAFAPRSADALYVGRLAVASSTRRGGVGRRLFEAIKHEARGRGLAFVELDVAADNEVACAFYATQGMQRALEPIVHHIPRLPVYLRLRGSTEESLP